MNKENQLYRFLEAQRTNYQTALSEIKDERKRSHWMWYVFPQIRGLGFSETSKFYAIKDRAEAEDFLKHPILGARLIAICNELLKADSDDPYKIFGSPDDMKLKSSMTLFSSITSTDPVFQLVLEKFFNGDRDRKTLSILDQEA